jgi:hypothetical protein
LRDTVASAISGDTVDLGGLSCNEILLTSGSIHLTQNKLNLTGPGASALSVDGGGQFSIFRQYGASIDATGLLTISGLTMANGKVAVAPVRGGCVYSAASVSLTDAVITGCTVSSPGDVQRPTGGGVYTRGNLTISTSTITNNASTSTGYNARGGGAYVRGNLIVQGSTISNNSAVGAKAWYGQGGGLFVIGNTNILGSTISGNRASSGGGLLSDSNSTASLTITNSTISGNAAAQFGGIYTLASLTLRNSTIAFNQAAASQGGLVASNSSLELQSSIIADNVSKGLASDLGCSSCTVSISSANNLITSSTVAIPADTITDCPRLGPLADNGGGVLTHALLHTSPAIDAGNNAASLTFDERGSPRVFGAKADIGAYEWQWTLDDRLMVSGFEAVCDQ